MNIFFSWQSDTSLKNNKNFIEDCIKVAIKEVNSENKFLVDFQLDKDTTGEPGNPEIIKTILDKIDNCKIFVCDLSIINQDYAGKKTPNPNVIFELGYAIKSLGWEKVICVVNQEYGVLENMPFDIRHRRLLAYNLSIKDKKVERRKIIDAIKLNINILKERGLIHDELDDYFKCDIDTEFITICNHLRKVVLEKKDNNLLNDIGVILNLDHDELISRIANRKVLGFHLFKHFELNVQSTKKLIDNVVSVSNFKKEKLVILVKLKEWLEWYNKFTNSRTFNDLFLKQERSETYKLISSNDPKLADRLILGRLLPDNKVSVEDFGDISFKPRIKDAVYYHQINPVHLKNYSNLLYSFVQITNEWLDKTGGEFILDTHKQFEIKQQ